jgi:hypothetical protein
MRCRDGVTLGCALSALALALGPSLTEAGGKDWKLSATPVPGPGHRSYWVGLTNQAKTVQLFCEESFGWELEGPRGRVYNGEVSTAGKDHPCQGDGTLHRVLPGETLYWRTTVPPYPGRLVFHLSARRVDDQSEPGPPGEAFGLDHEIQIKADPAPKPSPRPSP